VVVRELEELRASIDREVLAITSALSNAGLALGDDEPGTGAAEHLELRRQLGAVRDRVAAAGSQIADPRELRAELATLLSFACTLRTDAEALLARLRERVEELAREQAAARLARQRHAAEREELIRRRDALQARIVQAAGGIAAGDDTECRGTVPVIRLDEDLTVCSMGVATPKRRLRSRRFWLVTLTESRDDVLVRRT
jgi:chromosome segregation ATPase